MPFLSSLTITTVGLACKALLAFPGACHLSLSGLHTLRAAIEDDARRIAGRGVVTVANHISTLDDPLTWGVLPASYYPRTTTRMRWALGASDVMFTNPLFSHFFRLGNVYETFRGSGIYQHAVDMAIHNLNKGQWVHLFGEGKINQKQDYRIVNGRATLPRFKWGVGRILMETAQPPLIIPMWLSGFDTLMPEGRSFPWKFIPRVGRGIKLSISFGDPIDPALIADALNGNGLDNNRSIVPQQGERAAGWMGSKILKQHETHTHGPAHTLEDDVARIRSQVTAIIQRAVEDLGRTVDGDLLGAPTPSHHTNNTSRKCS